MQPKFSIALIARNEEKTLPRLLGSLASFKERGGEIILVDTGSTDNTAEVARDAGCIVHEVGNKFRRVIDDKLADRINMELLAGGDKNIVAPGDSLFDYSAARNYASSLASNDMIAMPDCDEAYTKLEIDVINKLIEDGAEQLEYHFVFSHDNEGNELIRFLHSKFYDRRKMCWVGIIHEVLSGEGNRVAVEENVIKLEHWQNHETDRSHYLKGLALSVLEDPDNDRNLHYFGRELMYSGRFKSAIEILQRHVAMGRWPAERSQSQIHIGDCYLNIGETQKAIHSFIDAFDTLPTRREPLMRIAEYYYKAGSPDHVIGYVAAALQMKGDAFYANFQPYYENVPHEWMYWALWQKNEYLASKQHFDICMAYQPFNSKYLHDFRYYYELPKISIIAPIKGRPEGTDRLVESIKRLNYPQEKIEVVLLYDGEKPHKEWDITDNFKVESSEESQGVPKTVKRGVEVATGDWIVYAANDMEFEPDCIIAAFKQAMDNRRYFMAFHDGEVLPDEGNICTHFMIHKKLLSKIGDVFDTDFYHVGVDNLLWAKMKKLGQAMHCARAKIIHRHFSQTGHMDEVHKVAWQEDRVKHDRELLEIKLRELNQ